MTDPDCFQNIINMLVRNYSLKIYGIVTAQHLYCESSHRAGARLSGIAVHQKGIYLTLILSFSMLYATAHRFSLADPFAERNHTLAYYKHRDENGCYFSIHSPKTRAGKRQISMTEDAKNAFLLEKEMQELSGTHSNVTVDGYQNFIFVNRFGGVQHQGSLNKALRRIIRDYNDKQFLKEKKNFVLLPNFTCHSLRHTFTTRLVETGMEKQTGRG